MNECSKCQQNIEEVNDIFDAVKKDVPEDRHYVFADYDIKKRDICIECYIKIVVMIQMLPKCRGK